jgi:hypothetical protein
LLKSKKVLFKIQEFAAFELRTIFISAGVERPDANSKPPNRRRSQVVRQRSAKPLFIGSIPIAASNQT